MNVYLLTDLESQEGPEPRVYTVRANNEHAAKEKFLQFIMKEATQATGVAVTHEEARAYFDDAYSFTQAAEV